MEYLSLYPSNRSPQRPPWSRTPSAAPLRVTGHTDSQLNRRLKASGCLLKGQSNRKFGICNDFIRLHKSAALTYMIQAEMCPHPYLPSLLFLLLDWACIIIPYMIDSQVVCSQTFHAKTLGYTFNLQYYMFRYHEDISKELNA
jgi:hypothetical protein